MDAGSDGSMEALYRAAVGPKKADFYVPKFIRFDQPNASNLSWNWPAFFVSFYWFLYRRMYAYWAIYCLLIPIVLAVASGIVGAILGTRLGNLLYYAATIGYSFVLIPLYANHLYHRAIKRRIGELRQKVHELPGQLLVLDNTPHTTNIIWVLIPFFLAALSGMLAAIAIPAYQNYVIRAQVTEGLMIADQLKSAVVISYQSNKTWPESISGLRLSRPMSGRYVAAVTVDHGIISVRYGNQANAAIDGHVLSFRPAIGDQGVVLWTCGYAVSRGNEPDIAAAPGLTDVKPQYLPASCLSG